MSPATFKIWRQLERCSGPCDRIPHIELSQFASEANESPEVCAKAVTDLKVLGFIVCPDDSQLSNLMMRRRVPGQFVFWLASNGDGEILSILSAQDAISSVLAERELLRRRLQHA